VPKSFPHKADSQVVFDQLLETVATRKIC